MNLIVIYRYLQGHRQIRLRSPGGEERNLKTHYTSAKSAFLGRLGIESYYDVRLGFRSPLNR
jgi:hypothetical protein